MPSIQIIFVIVAILVSVIVNGIVAYRMSYVAKLKGYEDKDIHAFSMCFWLGFIGWIYVAMLPNLTLMQQNQELIDWLKKTR